MDLRAMLNDSSSSTADKKEPPRHQPPRIHTSQSSYSDRPPSYDAQQSHPQSAYAAESRSAGSGYFPPQSPAHQNSASTSTPSAGTQSASGYGQSPGTHGQYTASRESSVPYSSYPPNYVSPTPANPYPPTTPGAGSTYQQPMPQQTPTNGTPYSSQLTNLQPRPPTREGSMSAANGVQLVHHHQMSPPANYHQPPSTPLGPPTTYHRPSPQAQRPGSQGHEIQRRTSISSVGSAHSRDLSMSHIAHPPAMALRDGSVQRPYSGEEAFLRERERSIESVSPKTIPRPTPQRQSTGSHTYESTSAPAPQPHYQSPTPSLYSQHPLSQPPATHDRPPEHQPPPTSQYSHPPPPDSRGPSTYSSRPTPDGRTNSSMTPQSTHSSLPPQASPVVKKEASLPPTSLKRNASVISTTTPAAMPPKKRLRRDEIPKWAHSARDPGSKPIKFDLRPPEERPRQTRPVKHESAIKPEPGPPAPAAPAAPVNGQTHQARPDPLPASSKWEESITNKTPYEDLTKSVCDWIYLEIGQRQPPPGAAFEVEAKIGAIIDVHAGRRLHLPVRTECMFDRGGYGAQTKFESTMNMEQHRHLNEFLNKLTHDSFREAHTTNPTRDCIRSAHTVEVDEFLELSEQGVHELPPSFQQYLPRGRPPKVRRTTNKRTGEVTALIIKSRISDLEVYNPNSAFDYRISINLEAPWSGNPAHLIPVSSTNDPSAGNVSDRLKDRISYRHLAYQIDLTQISHANTEHKDHELEIEISVDEMRREIDRLVRGETDAEGRGVSRYEDLVRGLVNNVRILARKGGEVR